MSGGHGSQNVMPNYWLIYIFRFLLASLNIDAIMQESTLYRRRERLNKMIDGLGLEDVYGATIERIKAQRGDKSKLGMGALMWICHAERPLSPDQLCHALAIESGSTDFDSGNIPSIPTLVSCCQGLITVDKEGSTVRLIHFTLREYLSSHPHIFYSPHSTIAEVCLTYLNSQQVKALSDYPTADLRGLVHDKPMVEYCSLYWGVHAKKDLSDCTMSLALQLFKEYDGHISAKVLVHKVWNILDGLIACPRWSGMHCASFFGIFEVVAALIEMGCYDLNEGDWSGCTALSLAAEKGHEGVVKILLEREEVNPDKSDNDGRTPLSYAAVHGREGVVGVLLERQEVNPNKPNNYGQTPLIRAAGAGNEGVVKILLEREEVNPDKPDNDGLTPLRMATLFGHKNVIAQLQSHEVSTDSTI